MARKRRPYTSKQCSANRVRAAQAKKKRLISSRQLWKVLRQGKSVDEMTKGCEGWT